MGRLNIKKDDKVEVIAGKDKGKKGKVLKVMVKENRVLVEGINKIKRHTRPAARGAATQTGGIIEKEAPLNISNISLICSKCGERIRIKRERSEERKKIRTCKKCGSEI